ncbi:hypothetical protein [Sorangium sp. So ce388]|uniref:hypothetical protein n=1 Tax=Sorangium sp. So ce388 TaxID=3133309 RepID=UPI003F5C92CD
MPRSESASASTQLGPQLAPCGPSEASLSAPSSARAEREDAAAVEICGRRRPFGPPVREHATSVTIHDVDDFENTWFDLTREIIHCSVTASGHAAAIEADVFKDLTNRPCGEELITSVLTYLERVEELPRKYITEPRAEYARTVRRDLKKAGLTDDQVTWWRVQLKTLLANFGIIAGRPDEL